jgi:hypothetical protein
MATATMVPTRERGADKTCDDFEEEDNALDTVIMVAALPAISARGGAASMFSPSQPIQPTPVVPVVDAPSRP